MMKKVASSKRANEPDRADRRQPLAFREPFGEAGIVGFTAAVAHLECWPLTLC